MGLVIFYNILMVVLIDLFFLLIWKISTSVWIPIELSFDIIVFPILLCVFNSVMFLKRKIPSFKILYLIVPAMSVLVHLMSYVDRGILTGHLFRPDEETVMLVNLFSVVAFIYSLILVGITNVVLVWRKKIRK